MVDRAVAEYNRSKGVAPGNLRYLDPKTVKAMIMVESAFDRRAYNSDPMQVNKPGDWGKGEKAKFGLRHSVPPGPELGIRAGIAWLDKKAYATNPNGTQSFKGWDLAVHDYNGNGNKNYLVEFHSALKLIDDAAGYDAIR